MAKYIVEIPDEVEIKDNNLCPFDMCRPSWWGETYQRGLDDAWKAAKTIADLSTNPKKRREMIGDYAPAYFVRTKTASEAIEAIRQWEQKQDEIQVGDVITDQDEKTHFLVFDITDKSYNCLSGKDFEPVYIGKDYISQYHNLKDRKDLKLVAEELLKQMQEGE